MHANRRTCITEILGRRSTDSIWNACIAKVYNMVGDGVAARDEGNSAARSGESCDKVRVRFTAPKAMIK
jgi:hypothetical protein